MIQTTPNGYARPVKAIAEDGQLWGLFLANDHFQYDEWICWGKDTPENRRELVEAGVPIIK